MSTKSKEFRKFYHRYEYLKLELEEIQEQFDEYDKDWNKRFGKYFNKITTELWMNEETGEIRKDLPKEKEKKIPVPDKVKKLYRKLAPKVHPDKGGDQEEFNDVKEYYEDKDLLGLLGYASKYDIDVDIDDNDNELMEESCKKLNNKIKFLTNSVIWNFYRGEKKMKKHCILQMELENNVKIDIKDYEDLLEN